MASVWDDVEIVVMTHPSKVSLTCQTLKQLDWPYSEFVNPDWEMPPDHPEWQEDRSYRPLVRGYALRQYRAFRGHQEMLRNADPDRCTLVFEDDMSLRKDTTPELVLANIRACARLLRDEPQYDAVSFHGRETTPFETCRWLAGYPYGELSVQKQTGPGHQAFLRPLARLFPEKYGDYLFRWHMGCLGYLAGPSARDKWVAAGHGHGMPCDLFLVNELNTLVLQESFLHHDELYGSLMLNAGECKQPVDPDGKPL